MDTVYSSNPSLQRLYLLLESYAPAAWDKEQKKLKISSLFKEKCGSFNPKDVSELRKLASTLVAKQYLPELALKIEWLADELSSYTDAATSFKDLPADVHNEIIRRIGIIGQAGIYSSNRALAKKMEEPLYEASKAALVASIENPAAPMSIVELIKHLRKCGPLVTVLDFSRLIKEAAKDYMDWFDGPNWTNVGRQMWA